MFLLMEILTLFSPCIGPKPGPPRNVSVTEISNGFVITWEAPIERAHLVNHYTIKYKTDGPWKTLNRGQIRPGETSYLGKLLSNNTGSSNRKKTYHISKLSVQIMKNLNRDTMLNSYIKMSQTNLMLKLSSSIQIQECFCEILIVDPDKYHFWRQSSSRLTRF